MPVLKIELSYTGRKEPVLIGLKRVSKPGLRVYVARRRSRASSAASASPSSARAKGS